MDTQGMSVPITDYIDRETVYPSMIPKKMTAFTDMERKELKEIINEVLDERDERMHRQDESWLYRGTY